MKKLRILGATTLVGALALLLSGCVSLNFGVTVNPDGKSASLSYKMSYNKKAFQQFEESNGSSSSENICDSIKKDNSEDDSDKGTWTETDTECVVTYKPITIQYSEKGITSSKENSDIVKSSALKITKKGSETEVSFDFSDMKDSSEGSSFGMGMESIVTKFDVWVTFPGKVSSASNDGKISDDGKTVTWHKDEVFDSIDSGKPLTAKGQLGSFDLLPIAIGAGIALLLIVAAVVVFLLVRKSGSNSAAQTPVAQPGGDASPTATVANEGEQTTVSEPTEPTPGSD